MRAPGVISICAAVLLLAAACGISGGGEDIIAGAPAVAQVPPPTTAPATTTTDALGDTTTAAPPATAPSSPKEPALPWGAHHGDQPEVVDHFGAIASDGDCDDLRTERDADREARDANLAQRATDDGARGRAELDGRWMDAAQNRMRDLRCPPSASMAMTP